MIDAVSRRGFLKVVVASIATPVIARIALAGGEPSGVLRVGGATKAEVASAARFANAIFTPGNFSAACSVIEMNALTRLPPGTGYEVRAVQLAAHEVSRFVRYGRSAYAIVWITEAQMQGKEWREQVAAASPLFHSVDHLVLARGVTGRPLNVAHLGLVEQGFDPIAQRAGALEERHLVEASKPGTIEVAGWKGWRP